MSIKLKDKSVNIKKLKPHMDEAMRRLGIIHQQLFNIPLFVTSGNDGKHSKNSRHYRNEAFDMRSWDKTPAEQIVWATTLSEFVMKYNLAVFDERARDHSPHWHIEQAD